MNFRQNRPVFVSRPPTGLGRQSARQGNTWNAPKRRRALAVAADSRESHAHGIGDWATFQRCRPRCRSAGRQAGRQAPLLSPPPLPPAPRSAWEGKPIPPPPTRPPASKARPEAPAVANKQRGRSPTAATRLPAGARQGSLGRAPPRPGRPAAAVRTRAASAPKPPPSAQDTQGQRRRSAHPRRKGGHNNAFIQPAEHVGVGLRLG